MFTLIKLLQEADGVAIENERARFQIEVAKQALDDAKTSYEKAKADLDAIISKSDELGIPRPKVKKLIEERTQALMLSGLVNPDDTKSLMPKVPKTPKMNKKDKKLELVETEENDLATGPANQAFLAN